MAVGRLTIEEQRRRIKLLLGFIFTFRYAIRKQLDTFVQMMMKIKYPQQLIEYTLRQGYISAYYEPRFRTKIYHLTQKGKDLLYDDEVLIERYHFEKSHAGVNTFTHHILLIQAFLLINAHLVVKEWICEWVLRIGKRKREKLPDGVLVLTDGTKVALEVESRYKPLVVLRGWVRKYQYDIEKEPRYHCVLVVAPSRSHHEGLRNKLFHLAPEFCSRRFVLTDLGMLKQGECLCRDKIMSLKEAFKLIGRQSNEKRT